MSPTRTINAILTHQHPAAVREMIAWWGANMPRCKTLVVYGGDRPDFDVLDVENKAFVSGEGHRTVDHQRERQSYAGVFAAAAQWLEGKGFEFVNLLEFDVLPLAEDWVSGLEHTSEREGAGLLCHHLQRVDRSFHPHLLNHQREPEFTDYWGSVTVRPDAEPVLSMIGCHSFWRRDAFEAVAAKPEPFPIYLELYLPTLAHHLGFRVREATSHPQYMRPEPVFRERAIEAARRAGAAAVHPVKRLWQQ